MEYKWSRILDWLWLSSVALVMILYDTISRNDRNQFLESYLVRSYKELSKKCCDIMFKEKKTPAIKCEKKPFWDDPRWITETSLRIMNLYWQVNLTFLSQLILIFSLGNMLLSYWVTVSVLPILVLWQQIHNFHHYLLFTCLGLRTQYQGDDNLEKP